jgi:hypothetical protein
VVGRRAGGSLLTGTLDDHDPDRREVFWQLPETDTGRLQPFDWTFVPKGDVVFNSDGSAVATSDVTNGIAGNRGRRIDPFCRSTILVTRVGARRPYAIRHLRGRLRGMSWSGRGIALAVALDHFDESRDRYLGDEILLMRLPPTPKQ